MHPSGSVGKIADALLFSMECCALLAYRLLVVVGVAVLIGWVAIGCPGPTLSRHAQGLAPETGSERSRSPLATWA